MICQREGCKNPLPPGRTKYCSDHCSRAANRVAARERSRARRERWKAPVSDRRAIRICLWCDKPFMSDGPWNRQCKRCARRLQDVDYDRCRHLAGAVAEPDEDDETEEDEE